MRTYGLILILFFTNSFTNCDELIKTSEEKSNEDEKDSEVFKPTSDWQKLPKDQAIPRGLHVRLNLQTGEREAKIYDPEEDDSHEEKNKLVVANTDSDSKPAPELSQERLKHILQKMEGNERGPSEEEILRVKSKFRSYDELKKELKKLEADIKTDVEIIHELIGRYKNMVERRKLGPSVGEDDGRDDDDDEDEELRILEDLEYLVHQYDNAREFVKTGLTTVVYPSLNSTSSNCRTGAVRLLGSAVQSNPGAQIAALESGAVQALLKTFALDTSPEVRSGALYALSCLVRRFPAAQAQFLEKGGLTVLSKIFESDTSHLLKLQIKSVTFINDLLLEKADSEAEIQKSTRKEEVQERYRQYNALHLEKRLKESEWCSLVVTTLERDMKGTVIDHDRVEKLIGAIGSLANGACKEEFRSNFTLVEILTRLEATYATLAQSEGDEPSYFSGVYSTIANLTSDLNKFDVEIIKDEL